MPKLEVQMSHLEAKRGHLEVEMGQFEVQMDHDEQTYGFPHQYSKTMLPAVFWLFFDVQKVKKIDPTHTAYVQDARRRGVYGSNMVVVAKKVKKSFTC